MRSPGAEAGGGRACQSSTGRGTSSTATRAGAGSATRCSRWTAFPGSGCGRATRGARGGGRPGFNRDGFLASGLRKPVHVMPLGVDIDHFNPGIRGVNNPAGDFVFLANLEWVERKRADMVLKVFNLVFRRSEPVALVCKVINVNGATHG